MKLFGCAMFLVTALVGCGSDSDDEGTPMSNGSGPAGTVQVCFGDACPMGECDNTGFFSDVPCSTAYSGPLGASSTLCGAASGDYCIDIGSNPNSTASWMVSCESGQATSMQCPTSCGVSGDLGSCE